MDEIFLRNFEYFMWRPHGKEKEIRRKNNFVDQMYKFQFLKVIPKAQFGHVLLVFKISVDGGRHLAEKGWMPGRVAIVGCDSPEFWLGAHRPQGNNYE